MNKFFLNLVLFLFFCSLCFAETPDYNKTAKFVCQTILNNKAFEYKKIFAQSFIDSVPEDYFHQITQEIVETTGHCVHFKPVSPTSKIVKFQFILQNENYSLLSLHLDDNHLIDSLLVEDVVLGSVILKDWKSINEYAQSLGGVFSITILSDTGKSESRLDKKVHPLGSAFKLYVLGALIDEIKSGKLNWDLNIPIHEEWKSLPSGVMQTWPENRPVSLNEYATYMIQISDNTATDHLIHILGRDTIENQLPLMNNDSLTKNRPFMTTAEMFKIKWAAPIDVIQNYIKGNESKKRNILAHEIANLKLSQVGTNGVPHSLPAFINDIEWFGSTHSLCQAMSQIRSKEDQVAMNILSKNVPVLDNSANSPWEYSGYKGGSEPGVLTMTYLLKSKSSHWGCVAVAWHNPNKVLNNWTMFDFVRKILKISASYF